MDWVVGVVIVTAIICAATVICSYFDHKFPRPNAPSRPFIEAYDPDGKIESKAWADYYNAWGKLSHKKEETSGIDTNNAKL